MLHKLYTLLATLLILETLTTLALSSDGNVNSVGGSTVNNGECKDFI